METAANQTCGVAECGEAGWEGELCGAAKTLLHQHAIQGDLSALQASIARFAAACRLNSENPLDPKLVIGVLSFDLKSTSDIQ